MVYFILGFALGYATATLILWTIEKWEDKQWKK